jgi:hypothetical protein
MNKRLQKITQLACFTIPLLSQTFAQQENKKKIEPSPIVIETKDNKLTISGKIKAEHYLQKNITLLNNKLPDQNEYFKNTFDLMFNYQYGAKTFGHCATEAYLNIRHKGVWGRGAVFADSDSSMPNDIELSETSFGKHSHTNGKPLIWLSEGWFKGSINAMFNQKNATKIHTIKIGWFPFELGRGIALGGCYGLNRELLGLYSYPEEKSSPGINISGEFIKDILWYDLYYSKFEERNKSNKDTFNTVKSHLVGRKNSPWRGVGKDDEIFAGRLIWKPFHAEQHNLAIEPYVFHNEASDQKVEKLADAKTQLESAGLGIEHSFKNFAWGGEVAFNYGTETLKAIDRNTIEIKRGNSGSLVEQYSHIYSDKEFKTNATVSDTSKEAAAVELSFNNDVKKVNNEQIEKLNFWSANDRFRPMYINRLRGWMGVLDAEYNFDVVNLKLAVACGHASGDKNPHTVEENKDYKGFIGLHELYTGKRVNSIIILEQRLLNTPSGLTTGNSEAKQDFAFSDLQHFGLSVLWAPQCCKDRNAEIKTNSMFFWKAYPGKKFDLEQKDDKENLEKATDEDARKFMGTELNAIVKFDLIKNMQFFGKFGVFFPGGYFSDVKGVPMKDDVWNTMEKSKVKVDKSLKKNLRLGDDTSYHINVGMEYKF